MIKTPLRYMGGKSVIAGWIVSHFPRHKCYVEVFGGAGGVLFRKPPSEVEVYNDIDGDVVNLFKVMRDRTVELKEYLTYTPFSREIYDELKRKYVQRDFDDDFERAVAVFFFLCRGGMAASLPPGDFSVSKVSSHATQYKNDVDALLGCGERLRSVTIENLDFRDMFKTYDGENTLFYCDPPYMDLKYYKFEFEYRDHYEMAKIASSIEGKICVSYYPHPNLEDLYPRDEWTYVSKTVSKAATVTPKEKREKAEELLLMNYKPPERPILRPSTKGLKEVFR